MVSAPHILVHFSLPAGQQPENRALEADGTADLTFAFTGQVVRVTGNGVIHPLASLPAPPAGSAAPVLGAPFTGGIVIAPDGTRYVNYSTGTAALTGIWRLDCRPMRIAALPQDQERPRPSSRAVDSLAPGGGWFCQLGPAEKEPLWS